MTGLKSSEWKEDKAAAQDALLFTKRGFQADQIRLAFIFPQTVSYIWQLDFQHASCARPHQLPQDRTCVRGILQVSEAAAGTGALHTCAESLQTRGGLCPSLPQVVK